MTDIFEKYTYRVSCSEEDEAFVGLGSEFSSLSWLAETSEKTLKGIHWVVKDCVEDMLKNGEEITIPISLLNYSGKFMVSTPTEEHRHLALEAIEVDEPESYSQ